MERATSKTSKNVPSLEEAERVVSFILSDEAKLIAGKVAQGTPMVESLREYLAPTIAVVGAAKQFYRTVGRPYPEQWESLERSAETFMDHFVVNWLAEGDPELKRAASRHRRRTLETEERVYQHLGAVTSNDPLVLSGQIVGLLCASECLLALFPSNKVAAFCVQLASLGATADAR